jgi:hypothetical protein
MWRLTAMEHGRRGRSQRPAAQGAPIVENNSRTDAPKHDVEPASTTHQKAGPAIRKGNPAKSAKPPSTVQIRPAPPFSARIRSFVPPSHKRARANCLELCSGRRARPLQVADTADGWRIDDLEGRGLLDLRRTASQSQFTRMKDEGAVSHGFRLFVFGTPMRPSRPLRCQGWLPSRLSTPAPGSE